MLIVLTLVPFLYLFSVDASHSADQPETQPSSSESTATAASSPLTVEAAREQAVTLHETMHSTLRVTHDRYYREDEGLPIPASILKEVFDDLQTRRGITLRWLAVEGQAMNTDHKPQNVFERQAVKALKAGRKSYEQTADGVFRRAAPITLSSHCLKCHVPNRRSTRDHTAGLIVSIPVK